MVATSSASTSLKDYLKKYTSEDNEKKKKRKKKAKPDSAGVRVVDEDPIWQKQIKPEDEEEESADEEKPQIDEDIEVKRMKRLELLRSKRPFGAISEDGSGWVSVSNIPDNEKPENQDSDMSPPRRRVRNDTPSPKSMDRPEVPSDTDLSPPRKRNGQTNSLSKSNGQKAHYDSRSPDSYLDTSQNNRVATDLSPPRRQRAEKYSTSPEPSRKSKFRDSDISPPRRKREGQSKSLSIPGGRKARYDTPSPDPYLEISQTDRETTDLSPPRRQRNKDLSPEPKRKSKFTDSDISPPRRSSQDAEYEDGRPSSRARDRSESNLLRKSDNESGDQSTGANAQPFSDLSPPRRRKRSPPPVKTGLVSGREIKNEIDRTRKDDWLRFQEMDPSVSGRDAEAVYRNKITGERMSKEEFLQSKVKKKEEKPKEIKLEWGKGLAQKREAEARLQELEEEKEMPFARSRDDANLDKMLKERVRWGDPMAHLVKSKDLEPVLPNLGDSEKMEESGFIIPQDIPSHSWIKRRLEAAPNRYGIKPGRHWDGVDRSTGYEKGLFKRTNEKKATEREAYLWSVSEM